MDETEQERDGNALDHVGHRHEADDRGGNESIAQVGGNDAHDHRSGGAYRKQLDEPITLEPSYAQAYERDGFVKVRNVFSAETIAHYRDRISTEVVRRNPATAPLAARDTYHKAFLQVTNLWRTNGDAREFVFGKRLAMMAAQLLGVERVRLYHDQALYKEPGGGITPWHADQFYWPLSTDRTITAWVPLQATPLEMGPIAFAKGSHRMTFGRDMEIGDESERSLRKALESGRFQEAAEPFEPGEVSFHSGWTFHHTGPNRSQHPRAVMTVIYMADGIRLLEPQRRQHVLDWEAFMPGVKPGEVVDSPLNPVLN